MKVFFILAIFFIFSCSGNSSSTDATTNFDTSDAYAKEDTSVDTEEVFLNETYGHPDQTDTYTEEKDTNTTKDATEINEPKDVISDNGSSPDTQSKRLMNVFLENPKKENYETTVMPAPHVTSEDGSLKGPYANVYNCLNSEEGKVVNSPYGQIKLCTPQKTVFPDSDGNYLHILPPADYKDPDDPFAEVMMYYHINQVHDYFKENFGFDGLDFSLAGVVNLEIKANGMWQPFDNAAFMPEDQIAQMGIDLGIKGDAIIFGQGSYSDFSYDSSVIYHEYTHAVVSENRLYGNTYDVFGLNVEPMAINEGIADYFSSSIRNDPIIGEYALDFGFMKMQRDISKFKKCPEDLAGEAHADGQIVSSTLWDIRKAIGQKDADEIIFNSLMKFQLHTTFHEAFQIILEEASKKDSDIFDKVKEVIKNHNTEKCERVKEFKNADYFSMDELMIVEGTMTAGVSQFSSYVPQSFQFKIKIPENSDFNAFKLAFGAKISDQYAYFYQGQITPAIAFRIDSPIAYNYTGNTKINADYFENTPLNGATYEVVIKGDCLKNGEYLYLQFINKTILPIQITSMKGEFITDENTPCNLSCCN